MQKYCFDKKYDVAVVGAGVAGIAAAIAAARRGRKTVLIEKQTLIGGLATSGLIFVYLPLCDGNGRQLISGISEEMLKKSCEFGPFDLSKAWGGTGKHARRADRDRYEVDFSPAGFTLSLDEMLAEAGVDLWLDSMIIDAETNGKDLRSVTVANASGQVKVEGKCFVDATGSAYVVQIAGGKVFRHENFLTPWVVENSENPEWFQIDGPLHVNCEGGIKEEFKYQNCENGKQVTGFVRKAWEMIRKRYDVLPEEKRKKNYPVHLPAMPQLRKIGRIDSLFTIEKPTQTERFEDSIGLVPDWRKPAAPWDTPYRALVPRDLNNLLAAGRCMGTAGEAWEVYRVIPVAAYTGEVAGLAASIAVEDGVSPADIDFEKLKSKLPGTGEKA